MDYKPMIQTEIVLSEAPENFRNVVIKELENEEYQLIKVIKQISFPYRDKDKEMVSHSAYVMYGNLAILFSQYGFSNDVSKDMMVVGDCKKFVEHWDSRFTFPVKKTPIEIVEGISLMKSELEKANLSYEESTHANSFLFNFLANCKGHKVDITLENIKSTCDYAVQHAKEIIIESKKYK